MAWSYCANTVKDLDPDRFLVTLNLPKNQHEINFALLAFNCEITKTASVVTQEMLGHIRYQWWREAIDELYAAERDRSKVRRHEVLQAMVPLSAKVPKHLLHLIIDAHVDDLNEQPYENLDTLELYCAKTSGTLLRLQGMLTTSELSDEANRNLNHLGAAIGLSGIALKPNSSKLIPEAASSEDLAYLAAEHLNRFNTSELPPESRVSNLYSKLVELRLKALKQAKYQPTTQLLNRLSASLPIKLWWARLYL